MNQDDAPFYLPVNNGLKGWFKSGAVGVNKLNGLMKTMVEKAGIKNDKLPNFREMQGALKRQEVLLQRRFRLW